MAQPKTSAEAATAAAFDSITKLEVPEAVREFAEKGVTQAKDTVAKFKVVADETSNMIEDAYSTTSKGTSTLGLKTLEIVRANTNAAFDHAFALFGVKTLSDAIELNTAFVRKQTETVTQQAKEFGELAQKVATEAVAPVKAQLGKAIKLPG